MTHRLLYPETRAHMALFQQARRHAGNTSRLLPTTAPSNPWMRHPVCPYPAPPHSFFSTCALSLDFPLPCYSIHAFLFPPTFKGELKGLGPNENLGLVD